MNKNKLFNILEMSNLKLLKYLNSSVRRKHYDVYSDDDNYFFAVPKNPSNHIMLVSHIDTVKRPHKVVLIEDNGVVTNANGVLGADDRAGVFAILEIAEKAIKNGGPLPYLLFTNYEETGGIGVKQFCKDKIMQNIEDDIYFMIELDRKGVNDAVYYDEPEAEVKTIIESIGYKEDFGTFSDVATLSDHTGIGHVNLSIGYFHEHSKAELLVLSVVEFAIENVMRLMPRIARRYDIDPLADKWVGRWGKWGATSYYTDNSFGKKTKADSKPFVYDYKGKKSGVTPYVPALVEKKDNVYYPANKVCPVCLGFHDIHEFKSMGYNVCGECGAYFNDAGDEITFSQSDEDALEMLQTMEDLCGN